MVKNLLLKIGVFCFVLLSVITIMALAVAQAKEVRAQGITEPHRDSTLSASVSGTISEIKCKFTIMKRINNIILFIIIFSFRTHLLFFCLRGIIQFSYFNNFAGIK